MPKSAKATADKGPAVEPLKFENALEKLEGIVESMEEDELPLETMLERYAEGIQLIKQCQSRLTEAELKIQQLDNLEEATSATDSPDHES